MAWKGRISRQVQELMILFQPDAASSAGAKQFIDQEYEEILHLNPRLPFLIRPGPANPSLIARYDFGVEEQVSIEGKSAAEILGHLKELSEAGKDMKKSRESQPTDADIIQTFPDDPSNPQRYSSLFPYSISTVGHGDEYK